METGPPSTRPDALVAFAGSSAPILDAVLSETVWIDHLACGVCVAGEPFLDFDPYGTSRYAGSTA